MTFGETLKQLREGAGLSQVELADKAGLSLRTIQSWEQGRRAPVSPDFFRLAGALGVSADRFAACSGAKGATRPQRSRVAKPKAESAARGQKPPGRRLKGK